MLKHLREKKGFTLIELLVVIAIIGILASTTLVGLNVATRNARDARRKSDLSSLQTALGLYYSENQAYPSTNTNSADAANWNSLLTGFMQTMPKDPKNTGANVYTYTVTANGYELKAVLEGKCKNEPNCIPANGNDWIVTP